MVFVFLLVGFFLINKPSKIFKIEDIKYVKIAERNIKVDLALTPAEQEKGLSGKNLLVEDTGMLFVFANSDKYPFWMKDMNFPIDIIWISQDQKVVYIKKNALPELYPETYAPTENAKYVLEITAGFADKYNLKTGDSVLFTY